MNKVISCLGVDTEEALTDGGTLAMPATRHSFRLKGARRAIGKLKERLSKFKLKSKKYQKQVDDDNTSLRPIVRDESLLTVVYFQYFKTGLATMIARPVQRNHQNINSRLEFE